MEWLNERGSRIFSIGDETLDYNRKQIQSFFSVFKPGIQTYLISTYLVAIDNVLLFIYLSYQHSMSSRSPKKLIPISKVAVPVTPKKHVQGERVNKPYVFLFVFGFFV